MTQLHVKDEDASSTITQWQQCLQRATQLLSEFQELKEHLKSRGMPAELPGLSVHVKLVEQEKKYADRALVQLCRCDLDVASAATTVKQRPQPRTQEVSNEETRWNALKSCWGLLYIGALFYRRPGLRTPGPLEIGSAALVKRDKGNFNSKDVVFVDAVVENGAKWLKFFCLSEKQLIWQMVDGQWDWDSSSDTESESESKINHQHDDQNSQATDSEDEDTIKVLNTAEHIIAAARSNRHNGQPPHVHFLFFRVSDDHIKDVDALLSRVRNSGGADVSVTVDCANSAFLSRLSPPPPLDGGVLSRMIYDERDHLTPTLNIDQEILSELASDLTNSRVEVQPWHVRHVKDQILRDGPGSARPLGEIHEILRGRRLVCTREAVDKFRWIVGDMGTETEIERARLLLPEPDAEDGADDGKGGREGKYEPRLPKKTREDTISALQKLSIHPIPSDLRLPVEIADSDPGAHVEEVVERGELPAIAIRCAAGLGSRDRAIFLYGWAKGITTVTCNKKGVNRLRRLVEESRTEDGEVAPRVYIPPGNSGNLARRERPRENPHGKV